MVRRESIGIFRNNRSSSDPVFGVHLLREGQGTDPDSCQGPLFLPPPRPRNRGRTATIHSNTGHLCFSFDRFTTIEGVDGPKITVGNRGTSEGQ